MIAWPPAPRRTAEAARRDSTTPATPPATPPPATYQPATGQEAHPGWYLPDLARAVLGQVLPFAAVLITSWWSSPWVGLGLSLAWWGYRHLTRHGDRTGSPSNEIARRLR